MRNNIAPKFVRVEFWFLFFAFNLFNDSLITQKYVKIEILEVSDHLLEKLLIWDHETWFTDTLWTLSGMWEMAPMG